MNTEQLLVLEQQQQRLHELLQKKLQEQNQQTLCLSIDNWSISGYNEESVTFYVHYSYICCGSIDFKSDHLTINANELKDI